MHQILVVDDGRIVQRGTHDVLVKEEGLYRRFVQVRQKAEGWKMGSEKRKISCRNFVGINYHFRKIYDCPAT